MWKKYEEFVKKLDYYQDKAAISVTMRDQFLQKFEELINKLSNKDRTWDTIKLVKGMATPVPGFYKLLIEHGIAAGRLTQQVGAEELPDVIYSRSDYFTGRLYRLMYAGIERRREGRKKTQEFLARGEIFFSLSNLKNILFRLKYPQHPSSLVGRTEEETKDERDEEIGILVQLGIEDIVSYFKENVDDVLRYEKRFGGLWSMGMDFKQEKKISPELFDEAKNIIETIARQEHKTLSKKKSEKYKNILRERKERVEQLKEEYGEEIEISEDIMEMVRAAIYRVFMDFGLKIAELYDKIVSCLDDLIKFNEEINKLEIRAKSGFPLRGVCDICRDRPEIKS